MKRLVIMKSSGFARQQRGVVLLITLIMLGIFSIIVFSMVSGSNTNFKIAGNQQFRMEAKLTASQAIETYISSEANFPPPDPFPNPSYGVDFDGDGTDDMFATLLEPECLIVESFTVTDVTDSNQTACVIGGDAGETSGNIGDSGSATGVSSLCVIKTYDLVAEVADNTTGAAVQMHQGVFVQVPIGSSCD